MTVTLIQLLPIQIVPSFEDIVGKIERCYVWHGEWNESDITEFT